MEDDGQGVRGVEGAGSFSPQQHVTLRGAGSCPRLGCRALGGQAPWHEGQGWVGAACSPGKGSAPYSEALGAFKGFTLGDKIAGFSV